MIIESIGILAGAVVSIVTAWKGITEVIKQNKKKEHDLRHHAFFKRTSFYIDYTIPSLNIEHKLKETVAKKFLTIKFKTFKNAFWEIVPRCNKESKDCPAECKERLMKFFIDLVKQYENEARIEGIPEIFIRKFGQFHDSAVQTTAQAFELISGSEIYGSCQERMCAVLDVLLYALTMTIFHVQDTISDLNGELERELEGRK